jgi:hypothetical protein
VSRLPFRMTLVATAAVATVGLAAGGAVAYAAGSPTPTPTKASVSAKLAKGATLAQIQAAAATAINARVASLNVAIAGVQKRTDLGADQAVLLHSLQGDVTGLQQLGVKIAAATDQTAARAGYQQIATNFLVYSLTLPVTHLVSASDRINNTVAPRLTAGAAKISAKLTPADEATVQPLLTDLTKQVAAAETATKGLPASLEAYTPSQLKGNHDLLKPARSDLAAAKAAITQARHDAKQAVADVRAGRAHQATPSAQS